MKKKEPAAYAAAAIALLATAVMAVLIAPLASPAIEFLATGKAAPPNTWAYQAQDLIGYAAGSFGFARGLMATGKWHVLAGTWLAVLLIGAAIIASRLRDNPGRDVKGGPLGEVEIVDSPGKLRKMNGWWDGKGELQEFGFVIGATKNGYYVDFGTPMSLVLGATGADKTQLLDIENMHAAFASGRNVVITGKDELLELTGEKAREVYDRVVVVSVSGYPNATRYNPLAEVVRLHEAGDVGAMKREARFVARALIPSSGASDATFFEDSARDILAALIIAVATSDAPAEQKNMQSVAETFFRGRTGSGDDPADPLKAYFRSLGPAHPCASFANDFLADGGKSKGALNVNTTVKNALQMFTDEEVAAVTWTSDVPMREVAEGRTAVYLMMPEKGDPYLPILACWLDSWWRTAKRVKAEHGGKLPNGTVLIGDEWGNQNRVDFFPELVTTGRSMAVKAMVLLQNVGQLNAYNRSGTGDEGRNTLLGSIGLKVMLNLNDPDTCQMATGWVGKRTVRTRSTSRQRGDAGHGSSGTSFSEHGEDLVHTWEWQSRVPDRDGAIVVKGGANGHGGEEGVMNTPLLYANETPAGAYFGLGDKEYERRKCMRFREAMAAAAAELPAPPEPWCPDFASLVGDGCPDGAVEADEASAWD